MDRSEALARIETDSMLFRKRLKRRALFWTFLFLILAVLVKPYVVWIAVVMVFLAIAQMAIWFITPDDTARLMQLSADHIDDVVWIYPMEWSVSPFGIYLFRRCYLKVYFADGHVEDIRIPPGDRDNWMRCLNVLFNGASFGFTEERSKHYSEDPESLRQDPDLFNQS